MPPIEITPEPAVAAGQRQAIEQELRRILESEFFSRSPRSQSFLRHVVNVALSGRTEDLKERTLGVELFDRDPAYDTGDDAIVRVKANEVRRRLAQCNAQASPEQTVRIELPAGSYAPQFHWLAASRPETPPSARPAPKRLLLWSSAAVCILLAISALAPLLKKQSALQKFWQPVVASSRPAMICLGHPVVYLLSKRVRDVSRAKYGAATPADPVPLTFDPHDVLGNDVIPAADQFVGVGDAQAGFLVGTFLRSLRKPSEMRIGSDVPFSDLRDFPVILVGAFSNRWTMRISNQFRFVFEEDPGGGNRRVVDRMQRGRSWKPPFMGVAGRVSEDFAIVSRVIRSQSGQIMISAAGITQFGSQAAGELLSDPQLFAKAMASAPADWADRNFQIVLKTKVFGASPGPPEVVATYFW